MGAPHGVKTYPAVFDSLNNAVRTLIAGERVHGCDAQTNGLVNAAVRRAT